MIIIPSQSYIGCANSGHPHCYPPSALVEGSPDVLVNGIPACRVGDSYATHGACRKHSPHTPVASTGSGSVLINGRPAHRKGDSAGCCNCVQGSANVIVGG